MSADNTEPRSAYPMTPGETAMIGRLLVAAAVGIFVTVRTPIPSGNTRGRHLFGS
jgi:hypothetical protein